MNIKLNGQITDITPGDLNDFPGIAEAIYEACDDHAEVMIAAAYKIVAEHEAYCERLIHFCHTGK
jgi:hypothetical protein